MKYIILPIFIPIARFVLGLLIYIVRFGFYVGAALIDFWNFNFEFIPDMWNSPFWDSKPSFFLYRIPYKVYLTFWDFIINKYEIRYTEVP